MQNLWILFIFIHSFLKGTRDGMQKAALQKSSSEEILFFFSLIGFLLIIPFSQNVLSTEPVYIFYAFLKSVVVSTAWIFSFIALKNLSISLYGVLDMSRMLFTTLLAVFLLGEKLTYGKILGLLIVSAGLIMVNLRSDTSQDSRTSAICVASAIIHCFLIAVSSTMDKALTKNMKPDQLQFFFMLFSTVFYAFVLIVKEKKITLTPVKGNRWIPLMSLSLVFGDRLMFKANASLHSQVTAMAIIKQSAVLFSVLTGWIFFKEKNIGFKMLCGLIILGGILICLFIN